MTARIYLDANADAPVLPQAWQAYLDDSPIGRDALIAQVAQRLACAPSEVYETSGGTEADALALFALLPKKAHVVTTSIEHAAVKKTLALRAARGEVEVTTVAAGRDGRVHPDDVRAALRESTHLVSCVLACNETGVIQPIAELSALCRARGVSLHTDAVAALGRMPVSFAGLGATALSLSGHKFGAMAGMGALLVRTGTPFSSPLWFTPSASLRGLRSLVAALSALPSDEELADIAARRDAFEREILRTVDGVEVLGGQGPRLVNTSCLRFDGCEGDGLVMALDIQGIAISAGSACASGSVEPSPILLGMGLSKSEARGAIRISLTRATSDHELARAAEVLAATVRRMRSL